MGGADEVVTKARAAFDDGAYRWGSRCSTTSSSPTQGHAGARELLADAHEQLGYQAEAGTWRNIYLTASKELRDGLPQVKDGMTRDPLSSSAMIRADVDDGA